MDLEKHMRSHAKLNLFKCAICDLSFNEAVELNNHIYERHMKFQLLQCDICSDSFKEEASYNDHVSKHLYIFECDKCPKSFKFLRNLRNHQRSHKTKKTALSCSVCKKVFSTSGALKKHALAHSCVGSVVETSPNNNKITNFKLLSLRQRSKTVSVSGGLRKHGKKHSNFDSTALTPVIECSQSEVLSFWCHVCECSFTESENFRLHIIQNHQNSESDESDSAPAFECSLCSKSFSIYSDLKDHKIEHSNQDTNVFTPFVEQRQSEILSLWCHVCKCSFAKPEDFRFHIMQIHKNSESDDSDSPLNQRKLSVKSKKNNTKTVKQQFVSSEPSAPGVSNKSAESFKGFVNCSNQNPVVLGHRHLQQAGLYHNVLNPIQIQQPWNSLVNINNGPNFQLSIVNQPTSNNIQQSVNNIRNIVNTPNVLVNGNHFILQGDSNNIQQLNSQINDDNSVVRPVSTHNPFITETNKFPEFDFDSEEYMRWLKNFVKECKSLNFPLAPAVVKQIRQVNGDVFDALIKPAGALKKKENHFYLFKFYKNLERIMHDHVKYHLASQSSENA